MTLAWKQLSFDCSWSFPLPRRYFHCSLIGYFLGLLTATVSSEFFKAAQPALLYLVPFTLLPLLVMAYLKVISMYQFTAAFPLICPLTHSIVIMDVIHYAGRLAADVG